MKINNVTYHTQRNNVKQPFTTCYSTSMATVLDYLLKKHNKKIALNGMQLDDYVHGRIYSKETKDYIKKNIGKIGSWIYRYIDRSLQTTAVAEEFVFNKICKENGLPYRAKYEQNVSLDDLETDLIFGTPQVLHGIYKSRSRVGGHVGCLVGCNDSGLFLHDPFGNAMSGYKNHNGKYVFYPHTEKFYDKKKYCVTRIISL